MPLSTQATTFFSLPVLKEYLGAKGNDLDARLVQVADGVTARIEALTGRKFVTRSVTWKTDAKGKADLRLHDFPVTGVTTLKTRVDLSSDWETFDAADYEADLALGIIYLKAETFYAGPLTTEAVYTAGFGAQDSASLPLFQEALDYCKFVFTRQQGGMLVASSVNQGNGASVIVVPEPPKDIRDAILAKRRLRL